jgi:putative acetyltransferase
MPLITEAQTEAQVEHVRHLLRTYRAELPPQVSLAAYDKEVNGLPGPYAPPRGSVLMATVLGQPAGCVCLRPLAERDVCEMKRLYVLPGFRGGSLGKDLIERIMAEARSRNYARLRLDTNPPSMQAAVSLYRRLGFAPISHVENAVSGFLYMELEL